MVIVSFVTAAFLLLPVIALGLPTSSSTNPNARGNDNGYGHSQATLASDALAEILIRGAPILGTSFIPPELSFIINVWWQVSTLAAQNNLRPATGCLNSLTALSWYT